MAEDGPGNVGPATDRNNEPVKDPSPNVLDLVHAETKRQDDLRNADLRRQDDLRASDNQHVREIADMRAQHTREMRQAEAERINAIRAVDVAAVQQAASVSATQATTLAAQVATSADTLRTQVAAAATAWESRLLAALDPIQKDIQDLRKAQYEAQGQKTQVIETRSAAEDLKPFFDQLQALIVAQGASGAAKEQTVQSQQTGTAARNTNINMVSAFIAALSLIALVVFALVR